MRDERSILIQTCSFVGTKVAKEIAIDDGGKNGRVYNADDFPWDEHVPVPYKVANKWSIIEFTNSGLKFSSAFPDLNELEYAGHRYAVSGLIGSSLYVLGGFTEFRNKTESTKVRRININNYKEGWTVCKPFDHMVADSIKVGFYRNYIYYFSPPNSQMSFCYIYDTSTQKGVLLEKPPCYGMGADICVPLEGEGMLIIDLTSRLFYINNPDDHGKKKVWSKRKDYKPLPLTNLTFGVLVSVLNGMLYLCDTRAYPTIKLYAYDCLNGSLRYQVELPKKLCRHLPRRLKMLSGRYCPRHLVAISDTKLCLLWTFADHVFCALVFVPPESNPRPKIVDVRFFRAVGERNLEINSCLSVDPVLGRMAKISTLLNKTREESKHVEDDKLMPSSRRCSGESTRPFHLKRSLLKVSVPTKKVHRKKVRKLSTKPTNSPTLSMPALSASSSHEPFDDPAKSLDTRKV